MKEKLNIYQKLVEIRQSVEYLRKEAKGYQYSYTKESQVIAAVRPKMDELGVLLTIDMLKPEISVQEGSGKIIQIGFEFTFINAENPLEQVVKHLWLQDTAGDPKKIGGLLTYAHRYFLLKFFQIATDDLDIDAYQEKTVSTPKTMKALATPDEIAVIQNRLRNHPEQMKTLLKSVAGNRIENITADKVAPINDWLDKILPKEGV